MTPRSWFMSVLLVSTAASLAGNVAAATLLPHTGAALPTAVTVAVASVAPLALPVAVHSVPVAARAAGAVRVVVVLAVAIVGLAAFAMSFDALARLAHAAGHTGWVGALLPVTLDVLAAASAVALVAETPDHPNPETAVHPDGAHPADHTPLHLVRDRNSHAPAVNGHPADAVAVTAMTSDDAHLDQARELVAAGVVRADAGQVAAALSGLAAGDSHRSVAAATGLHRTSVARLAAAAEVDGVGVG